jgi:hypothetical protein
VQNVEDVAVISLEELLRLITMHMIYRNEEKKEGKSFSMEHFVGCKHKENKKMFERFS